MFRGEECRGWQQAPASVAKQTAARSAQPAKPFLARLPSWESETRAAAHTTTDRQRDRRRRRRRPTGPGRLVCHESGISTANLNIRHPCPLARAGAFSLSLRGRHDGICPLALGLAPARIRLPSIKRLLRTSPRLSPSLCMEGLLYASGSRALIFCWSRDYSTTVLGGSESDPVTDSIVYAQSMILIKGGLCVGSPFQNLVFVSPPPPPPPPPPRRRCPSPVLSSSHSL